MEIGEKIKDLRKRKGLTQKELATLAGIPVVSLQQYESGKRKRPRIDQLKKIADAMDTSVSCLSDEMDFRIETPQKVIGLRIKRARKHAGLNQEQLASKIGVKRPVISKYESGAVNISVSQLFNLSDALNVRVSYLLDTADACERKGRRRPMSYYDIPDHPVIRNLERTGYPDGKEPTYPRCPVCGEECETMYRDRYGAYAGCDVCMETKDAWEVDVCFPEKDEI